MHIGLSAGAPARFLDESFISAEGIEVQIAFGDSPMKNHSKEKEEATIPAAWAQLLRKFVTSDGRTDRGTCTSLKRDRGSGIRGSEVWRAWQRIPGVAGNGESQAEINKNEQSKTDNAANKENAIKKFRDKHGSVRPGLGATLRKDASIATWLRMFDGLPPAR